MSDPSAPSAANSSVKPASALSSSLLEVRHLKAYYANTQVLYDVNFTVQQGEIVSLLGRNGMGKSTTVRTLLGLMNRCEGEVIWRTKNLALLPPNKIARQGIGWVPEGRRITPNLTVQENLVATHYLPPQPTHGVGLTLWNLPRVLALFPRLNARLHHRGDQLSGGEQQMLAIGRALMTNPTLLILDEATEGLAPLIRQEIWQCLWALKKEGMSILVIDKNVKVLCKLADRHFILEKGRTVWSGDSAALLEDTSLQRGYLGVS